MERDSFIFYRSFYEAINDLPEKNQLQVYKAICELSLNFQETDLQGLGLTIFRLIKPQLEANNKRFINGQKGGQYGSLGGRPKKPQKEPQENPKKTPNNNVNVNDNVNDNKKENIKRKSFIKPTILEIQEYCNERNNGINAEAFYDFYESKNWYVGKNKMKDWKACVRTWEKRNNKTNQIISTPEWFDKQIKEEQASDEDIRKLEERMKR